MHVGWNLFYIQSMHVINKRLVVGNHEGSIATYDRCNEINKTLTFTYQRGSVSCCYYIA